MSKHKLSDEEREELRISEELQRKEQELLARKSHRLKMEAKITLRSQTNFFVGFSENISEGGSVTQELHAYGQIDGSAMTVETRSRMVYIPVSFLTYGCLKTA